MIKCAQLRTRHSQVLRHHNSRLKGDGHLNGWLVKPSIAMDQLTPVKDVQNGTTPQVLSGFRVCKYESDVSTIKDQ